MCPNRALSTLHDSIKPMFTPRNYTISKFKKRVRITEEMHNRISLIRGRKTLAGKVDELLNLALEAKKLK